MSKSRPVFLYVAGAWQDHAGFDATSAILAEKGYAAKGITMASVGAYPGLENFDPDVEIVRQAVSDLITSGKDVVVVMHSYGSAPAAEAMRYFIDSSDSKAGQGKVVAMAWVTAFVIPENESLMTLLDGKDLSWWRVDVSFQPSCKLH
jgi:hypothetical protein